MEDLQDLPPFGGEFRDIDSDTMTQGKAVGKSPFCNNHSVYHRTVLCPLSFLSRFRILTFFSRHESDGLEQEAFGSRLHSLLDPHSLERELQPAVPKNW
jgi:hypothetical protein